jgi:hypothetical protein
LKLRKNRKERSGRRRFDDEPMPFFSDNGVIARQFELPGNSNRLIPPILEKFDVSFAHSNKLAYVMAYVKFHLIAGSGTRYGYPGLAFTPAASMPATAGS